MRLAIALALPLLTLAACDRQADTPRDDVQRIALDEAGPRQAEADPSPDTGAARWTVSASGQAIDFGNADEAPLLTLGCSLEADPPGMVIIRHARALPGQSALFPVLGNGMSTRFLADATLGEDEWHWEARLPADDPQWDVFAGPRELVATLPGRGTLEIAGSRIPGEFVEWCRSGGELPEVEPAPEAEETEGG